MSWFSSYYCALNCFCFLVKYFSLTKNELPAERTWALDHEDQFQQRFFLQSTNTIYISLPQHTIFILPVRVSFRYTCKRRWTESRLSRRAFRTLRRARSPRHMAAPPAGHVAPPSAFAPGSGPSDRDPGLDTSARARRY